MLEKGLRDGYLDVVGQDPSIYIEYVVPGFAAAETGRFVTGDAVTAIGPHKSLSGLSPNELRRLTIGAEETSTTVSMVRAADSPEQLRGTPYLVVLNRKVPTRVTRRNEAAVHRLVKFQGSSPQFSPSADEIIASPFTDLLDLDSIRGAVREEGIFGGYSYVFI